MHYFNSTSFFQKVKKEKEQEKLGQMDICKTINQNVW